MKTKIIAVFSIFLLAMTCSLAAQTTLKLGLINMNRAINESDEGKRSKQFLETQFEQTKRNIDQKKMEIAKMEKDLSESMMLNESAKKAKQDEIDQRKKDLVEEVKKEQNSFRQDEARHTQKIFQDLVSVVKSVAEAEHYDAIFEYTVAQGIIYTKYDITDITEKVILEYNKLQAIK